MANELDPRTRKEVFLAGMLYGDPDDLPDPNTRDELYMKAIAETIKEGGVPSPEGADVGDVLTIGADGPEWAAPSGGVELWQHAVYVTPRNTGITEINDRQFFVVLVSGEEVFNKASGKQQWAFYATSVNPSPAITVQVAFQGNNNANIQYGSSSTGNIPIAASGSGARLEWGYEYNSRII